MRLYLDDGSLAADAGLEGGLCEADGQIAALEVRGDGELNADPFDVGLLPDVGQRGLLGVLLGARRRLLFVLRLTELCSVSVGVRIGRKGASGCMGLNVLIVAAPCAW